LKQQKRPKTTRKINVRPKTSESGAKSNGPVAKPSKKVVTGSVATVLETPNVWDTPLIAAVWMLEANVMVAVIKTMTTVADHFLGADQFVGSS
jgi:hypothetical protein